MPRLSEDHYFEIPDSVQADAEIGTKLDKAWRGLREIEVYRWETSAETNKKKEDLLGKFYLCGDEEDEDLPVEPGQDPVDDRNEVIRWMYGPALQFANQEGRPVHCRARVIYCPKEGAASKTVYPQFTAFPEDRPEQTKEELDDDDDDDDDDELLRPRPLLGGTRHRMGLGFGLRHPMFGNIHQQEERIREREQKVAENERQTIGDVMDFLRDRAATMEAREARVTEILIEENRSQREQIKSLVSKQNESQEAIIGGRRAELEARREAQQALVDGIRMQAETANFRIDVERQRANEQIEYIRKDAKRENSGRLVQALLTPLIQSAPQTIATIGGLIAAMKGGQAPPVPPQAPQASPPSTGPTPGPWSGPPGPPQQGGQGATPNNNPIATGQPFAGCFITCNEVLASITDEQDKQLKAEMTESAYSTFRSWMSASSDHECIGAFAAFQKIGGSDAYEVLEVVLEDPQCDKIVKVCNQIQSVQPPQGAAPGSSVIDTDATESAPQTGQ